MGRIYPKIGRSGFSAIHKAVLEKCRKKYPKYLPNYSLVLKMRKWQIFGALYDIVFREIMEIIKQL